MKTLRTHLPHLPVLALAIVVVAQPVDAYEYATDKEYADRWMSCADDAYLPRVHVYRADNQSKAAKWGKFKNIRVTDLGGYSFNHWNGPPEANRISSIQVDQGTWEFCEDPDFGGECMTFDEGKYNAVDLGYLDEKISSFRPLLCGSDNAGTIYVDVEELPRPDEGNHPDTPEQFGECLHDWTGSIINNGRVHLKWSQNGVLSLIDNVTHSVKWKAKTASDATATGYWLCFDSRANLAIYPTIDKDGTPVWETGGVEANSDAQLILHEDCELTIADRYGDHWSSGTSCN